MSSKIGTRSEQPAVAAPRTIPILRTALLILLSVAAGQRTCPGDPQTASADETTEARIEGDSLLEVTVGMSGVVTQVILPGTELTVREVNPRTTAIAVRIDDVYTHGEGFRYDLTWFGLAPGNHNLCDYLARKDGTSTDELPGLSVTVNSILLPDQVRPHAPDSGLLSRIGGYRMMLKLAVVVWILGLLAIIFAGRARQRGLAVAASETVLSPVDHMRRLVDRALESGELSVEDKADLDVRILSFWCERRQLDNVPPGDALAALKNDDEAGPLLIGIERWFYSRHAPDREEIMSLLAPLAKLAATANATARERVS
ncbi:MAG TPA: hypothetical protein EYG03_09510 [Planctomycetes bacterium]|nr:hypothetical protein [Fuerstiella sp.]HIK92201.1 hypothetical protein [Planctomycetota bacterium]